MAPLRNIDVLNKALAFHEQARNYFNEDNPESADADVQELLARFDEHGIIIEQCEGEYVYCADPALLREWQDVSPQAWHNVQNFTILPSMNKADVLEMARQVDEVLCALYKDLRNQTECDVLREAIDHFHESNRRMPVAVETIESR